MIPFLSETWKLWYWALFCPSKLQQRMNESAPVTREDGYRADTRSHHILLWHANGTFVAQYLLLTVLFSLPLAVTIAMVGSPWDGLLVPLILLLSYGTGLIFIPLGLHIPLLFCMVYLTQPGGWLTFSLTTLIGQLDAVVAVLRLIGASTTSILGLVATGVLAWRLLQGRQVLASRGVIVLGTVLSVGFGSWLATSGAFLLWAWSVSALTGGYLLFATRRLNDASHDSVEIVVVIVRALLVAAMLALACVLGKLTFFPSTPLNSHTGEIAGSILGGLALGAATLGLGRVVLIGYPDVVQPTRQSDVRIEGNATGAMQKLSSRISMLVKGVVNLLVVLIAHWVVAVMLSVAFAAGVVVTESTSAEQSNLQITILVQPGEDGDRVMV